MTFVHTSWKRKGTNEALHRFHNYYVGEMATDFTRSYRLASGWNLISGAVCDMGLMAFKLPGDPPEGLSLSNTSHKIRERSRDTPKIALLSRNGTAGNVELVRN